MRKCKKCSGKLSKAYVDRELLWRCDKCGAITPRRKTPYKNRINGIGTLHIERTFKALGTTKKEKQIRRASGTNNKEQFNKIIDMLYDLQSQGKLDLLRDVRDGRLHPLELLERYQKNEHNEDPITLRAFGPELNKFVNTFNKWASTTQASYKAQLKTFLEVVDGSKPVKELPEVLETFYDICKKKNQKTKFNGIRNILSKFLNEKLGEDHKLWKQIRRIEGMSRKRDKEGRPLDVAELWTLIAKLPKPHAAIAETLALCGLHTKELWIDGIEVDESFSIRVHGKKTPDRDRRIPKLLDPVIKPTVGIGGFAKALTKYSNGLTTPKDLRGTFERLLEATSISKARVDMYMGRSVTTPKGGLYTKRAVDDFLKKDIKKIDAQIMEQLKEAKMATTEILKPDEMPDEEREAYEEDDL